jgi:hypothetical protein
MAQTSVALVRSMTPNSKLSRMIMPGSVDSRTRMMQRRRHDAELRISALDTRLNRAYWTIGPL